MVSKLGWGGWWLGHQRYCVVSRLYGTKTRLCAVGPGNTGPIQSRYFMGILLPSSAPACLSTSRGCQHTVARLPLLQDPACELWGSLLHFCCAHRSPGFDLGFRRFLRSTEKREFMEKTQTLNKLPLPKPLLYIQAIMTGVCQQRRIQRSLSATCLLMAVLAKSTTCSTPGCEIQPGRSV